jgi:serine/threonine protein kinase
MSATARRRSGPGEPADRRRWVSLATGVTALGEFDVHGVLGQGGSGVVYDARWGPRRVALKVPHAALLDTPRARAQFIAEAQRLQSIGHQAVVKVLAAGELPDGRPFLAMERLDGETLATTIARGPLALPHALALFDELCGAVGALHVQGLVHRDLKPENVFIVDGRHAVLLDFGIAKDLAAPASTTTQEGLVRGTPAYMAPERFFGQPASAATDIYELAVTLYAMIAGRLPWSDVADPEARLSPRALDGVPRALDIEIRRALSTRAQNRPGTPAVFLAAVRTAAAGDGEPSPADTAPMRPDDAAASSLPVPPPPDANATPLGWAPTAPAPTVRRRRRGWPLVGTGMAVAAVLGFVAVSHAVRTDEPSDVVTMRPVPVVDAGHALVVATPPRSSTAPDPWSGDQPAPPPAHREPVPAFALTAPVPIPALARAEARGAVAKLPGDARILATVQLAELRGNPAFAALLHDFGRDTRTAILAAIAPACVVEAMSSATWIALAAPSLAGASNAAAVVEGRWQRADVARCLADDHDVAPAAGGYKLADAARLAFLDDHSFVVSTRDDREGPLGALAHAAYRSKTTLAAQLAPDAALAFAIDGTDQQWPDDLLPAGTSATGALYLDGARVRFAVSLTLADADAADRLAHAARAQLDAAVASTGSRVDVTRAGDAVTIRGTLGADAVKRVADALK